MAKVSETSINSVFGLLTVAAISVSYRAGRKVICYCHCGRVTAVSLSNLGIKTNSCGCDRDRAAGVAIASHGKRHTPEYSTWCDMWKRCTNPKAKGYQTYKDRVPPDRWKDFQVFYKDMGPRPSANHSIDRKDNTKGYGPENCRWATPTEQMRNLPNVRLYSKDGGSAMTLEEVSKIVKVLEGTLRHRLLKQQLPIELVLGEGWAIVQGTLDFEHTLKVPDAQTS